MKTSEQAKKRNYPSSRKPARTPRTGRKVTGNAKVKVYSFINPEDVPKAKEFFAKLREGQKFKITAR